MKVFVHSAGRVGQDGIIADTDDDPGSSSVTWGRMEEEGEE